MEDFRLRHRLVQIPRHIVPMSEVHLLEQLAQPVPLLALVVPLVLGPGRIEALVGSHLVALEGQV